MKRKYMPGFGLQWKTSMPLVHATESMKIQPFSKRISVTKGSANKTIDRCSKYKTAQLFTALSGFMPEEKGKEINGWYKQSPLPADTLKKQPLNTTDSLPINKNAEKSHNNGVAALLSAIGSLLLLFVGPGLETGTISYLVVVTVFIILMLLCLAFACDAVSYGIKAFKQLTGEKGKYRGLDKALLGFILGIICLIYFSIIAIVFVIVSKVVF